MDAESKTVRLIVGIGASAGGLKPLQEFVSRLEPGTGASYVIVQHLDPTHKSMLVEILGRASPLPVSEAEDGMSLVPDQIFVIPPDNYLEISGDSLALVRPGDRHGSRGAIDHFFRSLGRAFGDQAVGILFSGAGHDGTAGLRTIRAQGGLVLVQAPDDAEHSSMPASAIDADVVDKVSSVEKMIPVLREYARNTKKAIDIENDADPDTPPLETICDLLEKREDFIAKRFKPATLTRRVLRRVSLSGADDIEDYVDLLKESDAERRALIDDLMINVTNFFRDREAFETLKKEVVADLVEKAGNDRIIRIWVPGCASGEEAYSLAMIFTEALERADSDAQLQVFATDLDADAIGKARSGEFPASIANTVPPRYLGEYFTRTADGNTFTVASRIRDHISFAVHDIASDPPFNRVDLISCRNLLIYLKREFQESIFRAFRFALNDDGYLFLGTSETVGRQTHQYAPISEKWSIYRKLSTGINDRREHLNQARQLGYFGTPSLSAQRSSDRRTSGVEHLRLRLLEKLLPPGVVIDEGDSIVYSHGDWKAYMDMPSGVPNQNITSVVVAPLRGRLRSALSKVRNDYEPVGFECTIPADGDESESRAVYVELVPIRAGEFHKGALVTVVFHDLGARALRDDSRDADVQGADADLVRELEEELGLTRQELQNTIEELETSSEELQTSHEEALATNEELQSTNEELEASSEELRSVNEELSTVNAELKDRLGELQSARADIENFFESTNVPTVFVRPNLDIAKFTPAAARLLDLKPRDVDKPLRNGSISLIDDELLDRCRNVLEDFQPWTDEVRADDGRWFTREVKPYRTEERRIEGVVLVFQDITRLKELSKRAELREAQQSAVADLELLALSGTHTADIMQRAVVTVAGILEVDLCEIFRYRPASGDLLMVCGEGWPPNLVGGTALSGGKENQAGHALTAKAPVVVRSLRHDRRFKGPSLMREHDVVSGVTCRIGDEESPWGVLGIHSTTAREFTREDVSFLVSVANLLSITLRNERVREALHQSESRFRSMANAIPQLAWITDETGAVQWFNERWYEYTGTTIDEMKGWGWKNTLHPDSGDAVVSRLEKKFSEGEAWEDKVALRSKEGEYRWFLSRAEPIRDEDGRIVNWFGTNTDITDQLQYERALEASEEKIRIALQTNQIGTFEHVFGNGEIQWDNLLKRLWGIDDDDRPTKTLFWDCIHPDDTPAVKEAIRSSTDPRGDGRFFCHYRVINRKTLTASWLESSGQTFFDKGEPTRMIGLVIDITERKELEESLQQAVTKLTDADERKNEFLAVLGHELRNPLAVISSSIETLESEPARVDSLLPRMSGSVATMTRLLGDLLDLHRIDDDRIELDVEPLSIGECWSAAVHATQQSIEEKQQTLRVDIDDDLLVVGDRIRLEQLFSNLLWNANKYTPEGGTIAVSAAQHEGTAQISVRDSGIGIEREYLHQIFNPYFRVPEAQHGEASLGMGLAIAKKLANLHGGEIVAFSDGTNQGTTFLVELPAVEKPAEHQQDDERQRPERLPEGLEVVLIEDNADLVATLPQLLESIGCSVRAATTGDEGVAAVRAAGADAVLVDIGLPDISGYEVAETLRADGFDGLIVAVSGFGHGEARRRSLDAGFDHHLAKPASLRDIANLLAKHASEGRSEDR